MEESSSRVGSRNTNDSEKSIPIGMSSSWDDKISSFLGKNTPAILLPILLLLLISNFLLWTYEAIVALTTPYSMDYGEGFVLYFAQNWELMYDPISSSPYLVTNYPPVYPILAGTLDKLFDDIFFTSRLLSIISTTSIAALISSIVYKNSSKTTNKSAITGVLTGLLFLFSTITSWGMLARVDILGVLFGILAIFWYLTRRGRSQIVGAVFFSLLALFTKQSLFAAPAAIFLALMFENEYEQGVTFAVGLGAVGFTLLTGLMYITEGQAWLHLVEYNQNSFSFYRMFATIKISLINFHPVLIGFAGATVLRYYDEVPRVLIFYFLIGGIASLLAGKVGSGSNYFLSFLVAITILSGIFLSNNHFTDYISNIRSGNQNVVPALITILLIVQFSLFIVPPSGAFAGAEHADNIIESSDGPILSEDSGLLVNNNQTVLYQPFIMNQLIIGEKWDQGPVIQSIQNTEYEYIILHFDVGDEKDRKSSRWSPDQMQAIDNNYQLYSHSGRYWIYTPERESDA